MKTIKRPVLSFFIASHPFFIEEVLSLVDVNTSILVYPNPTKDYWSIALPTNAYKVMILNAQGQLIEETKISSQNFKSGNYESGVYWISIVDFNNEIITVRKAIKL